MGIASAANPPPDPLGVMDVVGTYEFLYVHAIDREGNESKYMASGEVQNVTGITSHSLDVPDMTVDWAYGKDRYSFIETITISPTSGNVDTTIV